ncbi:MAG TPA: YbhB/YbcL family Raf kinase inhibitor-like protein [Azospirillum sp.]|nr:YbhB/YbcL family Raf kinase inhibitor-like protein [Azospirillum sp.]
MRTAFCALAAFALAGTASASAFELASADLKPDAAIPNKHVFNGFGCKGDNLSPALAWKGAPAGTRSYAVTVYDPDAPTGSGWWHWVVFNLPASATGLPAGAGSPATAALPAPAVQSRTDFGAPGYGGPCPPPGDKQHRYVFTVYALKVDSLPLGPDASGAMVGFNLNANTLAKASLTATYGR